MGDRLGICSEFLSSLSLLKCKLNSMTSTTFILNPIYLLMQFKAGFLFLVNVESTRSLKSFSHVLSQPPPPTARSPRAVSGLASQIQPFTLIPVKSHLVNPGHSSSQLDVFCMVILSRDMCIFAPDLGPFLRVPFVSSLTPRRSGETNITFKTS